MLPNVVIIGAPKSGTTSLFYYLKQHPEVFLPVRKELHYFTYTDLAKQAEGPGDRNTLQSLCSDKKEYEAHYGRVDGELAVVEASPSYLYFPNVAHRIKKELGSPLIIAILRNPLEKAFSQYTHLLRAGRETMKFYDALMQEEKRAEAGWSDFWRYAESSLYSDRIEQYLSVFGQENVMVILFDDLVAETQTLMKKVFTFIGVDPSVKIDTSRVYNRSGKPKFKLVSFFLSNKNPIKSLAKMMLPERLRIALRLRIIDMNTSGKGVMDERSKVYLKKYFANDISRLEHMIGTRTYWLEH